MGRPTGYVWLEGRVTCSTRRCVSFRALDLRLRERHYHLPRVHLAQLSEGPEDRVKLLVPLWWAYQHKLKVEDADGRTRVLYRTATGRAESEPSIQKLTESLLARSVRRSPLIDADYSSLELRMLAAGAVDETSLRYGPLTRELMKKGDSG